LVALRFVNLGPLVARAAGLALNRTVAIGDLHLVVHRSIRLSLRDARLANAPDGSQPDMATIGSLTVEIAILPLFAGRLQIESATIDSPTLFLGRDAAGRGNWQFGAAVPKARPVQASSPAAVPARAVPPVLHALDLRGGTIVYRTTSGALLRIELHDVGLRAPVPDQPLALAAKGAYNGTPIRLTVSGQSMDVLRDPEIPYGATVTARSGAAAVGFKGTLVDPLAFDGVRGSLTLDAPRMTELLAAAGMQAAVDLPLNVAAVLEKRGDSWKLTDIRGTAAKAMVAGTADLLEGARGQPDRVALNLRFGALDLDAIAVGLKSDALASDDLPVVEIRPGTLLDAKLAIESARFGSVRVSDVVLHAVVAPGRLALNDVTLAVAGGTASLSASAEPANGGTRVVADAALAQADAAELIRWSGGPPGALTGHLDGAVSLQLTGATLPAALAGGRISAVAGMRDGRISHTALELASTDLRSLFRHSMETAPLLCLLAVGDLKDGKGQINPLRLETADAIIFGGGLLDLVNRRIDLTVESDAGSTSIFALDIPIRISGPFDNPDISAALLDANRTPLTRIDTGQLPPALLRIISGNECRR
jgi:uncharacterized protein involved in outer membrane biogenesis